MEHETAPWIASPTLKPTTGCQPCGADCERAAAFCSPFQYFSMFSDCREVMTSGSAMDVISLGKERGQQVTDRLPGYRQTC